MAKPVYEIHIDAREVAHTLAEIEQGNPQRMFTSRTFAGAWAIGNAVRFASGLPMVRKPKPIRWPGCMTMGEGCAADHEDACIVVKIVVRQEVTR